MARYGRDYGPARGGYDRGFGGRAGGSYYGQGGGFRRPGGGYDEGYQGGGWGMEGLYNSIVGRAGERGGYDRGYRAGGGGYDRDFYRRDFGGGREPSPFGGMNPGGRSRFGSGYGGSERGGNWRGMGQNRGYDRSFGNARVDRSRYDRGWS